MRCPKCKGSVPNRLTVITCPSCGAPVRRIPITKDIPFAIQVMAERNGWIFWGLLSIPFWIFFAMFELVFGTGDMAKLFDDHLFTFLIHAFFSGLIMDILMKTNAYVMRISEKATLKRAPRQLRQFRLGTNLSLLIAIFLSIWYFDFRHWASAPFMGTLLTVLFIGLWWSWYPFIINLEDMNDRRIADFFLEWGVEDLGQWRRMAVWVLWVYVLCIAVAAYMIARPGAYRWLTQSDFIQFIVSRTKMLFFWVPDFFK
ncbi:MAG: hypothetical protein N2450_08620 [bacterium]|nr:hypothetical protein [bacterium]